MARERSAEGLTTVALVIRMLFTLSGSWDAVVAMAVLVIVPRVLAWSTTEKFVKPSLGKLPRLVNEMKLLFVT